jgi:signal transduction histidine kinase
LVEDILDLANIDAGSVELDFDTVDVRASVDAAIAGLRERIESAHVEVAVRIDPSAARFVADGKRIRQVLFNLLKNAIGYSQAGQTVRIEARAEPDAVLLEVSDHGSGIPREIIEKVFERFETHTIGRNNKGAGLGLAIVRSFVELHGGTVALDSVEGQGTTVTCRFPISGGEPARAAA